MRLIDVQTLELKEFFDAVPLYAILSHTWGAEEVTFQDYLLATDPNTNANTSSHIKRKAGFAKIIGACKRARADGLQYVWCDTNCIDKRSSAELSEAINSMYAWYRDSVICYAYLADVDETSMTFAKSRWFSRGWTLQELLAPSKVLFFDKRWAVLGDREALATVISDATRIHIGALRDRDTISEYSIAQRMSWAAGRETSRQEDIAYCLLGIFDIYMLLLYGEGQKAFLRLQQEIIKVTDDQSLLAWDLLGSHTHPWSGVLALSPASFRHCGSIIRNPDIGRFPFATTNLGISIRLPIIRTSLDGVALVGLNCSHKLCGHNQASMTNNPTSHAVRYYQVWIWLRNTEDDIYERTHIPTTTLLLDEPFPREVGISIASIFMSTTWANAHRRLMHQVSRPRTTWAASSAGFLITIGFGDFQSSTNTYNAAYLPGDISIVSLKRQGRSTSSHVLVSDKSISIIMSIAWDEQGHALKWRHTCFPDSNMKVSNQMMTQKEWQWLFDENWQEHIADKSSCCAELDRFHYKLEKGLHIQPRAVEDELAPFVEMEQQLLWDLCGQQRVAVQIIFQEPPKEEPLYDVPFNCT
ncbi:HET-domain-containing protein [Xylariaceae sp. FL1651]|nr:HET-domain-containing protein [Xylariaceae sp. FL1651]